MTGIRLVSIKNQKFFNFKSNGNVRGGGYSIFVRQVPCPDEEENFDPDLYTSTPRTTTDVSQPDYNSHNDVNDVDGEGSARPGPELEDYHDVVIISNPITTTNSRLTSSEVRDVNENELEAIEDGSNEFPDPDLAVEVQEVDIPEFDDEELTTEGLIESSTSSSDPEFPQSCSETFILEDRIRLTSPDFQNPTRKGWNAITC